MSYARQMLDTYSRTFNVDAGLLAAAIDALSDCVQACNADNAGPVQVTGLTNATHVAAGERCSLAVSLAWAGADTAPAMPSATAAQPPARTSSRDRRKTFIVFPLGFPARQACHCVRTEPRPARLIHRGASRAPCHDHPAFRAVTTKRSHTTLLTLVARRVFTGPGPLRR